MVHICQYLKPQQIRLGFRGGHLDGIVQAYFYLHDVSRLRDCGTRWK